jgi:Flp pilus assembly protein protease CpaA
MLKPIVFLAYIALLITAGAIDIQRGVIPDKLVFVILFLSIPLALLIRTGILERLVIFLPIIVLLAFLWLYTGGIGGGDIKLIAASGIALTAVNFYSALLISFAGSAIFLNAASIFKIKRIKYTPFAPFWAIVVLVSHFLCKR